jgi:hypothetical protein
MLPLSRPIFGTIVFLATIASCLSVDSATAPAPQPPKVGPGYCRFPGSISPDGAYLFAWAPSCLTTEQKASLKEWPEGLEVPFDDFDIGDYLFDAPHNRLLSQIPEADFFEGRGARKNRGELYVAWSPDSRSAIAICQERWDDNAIVWVDPTADRIINIKPTLEHAFGAVLHQRKKEDPRAVNMQFSDPAILPGGILVVDGDSGHEKEGPYYTFRLTCRVTFPGNKPHIEILKSREVSQQEHTTGVDYEPDLNKYYGRLRARLDDKAKATLKKEEQDWIQWRDAQPETAREQLTQRRAVELRARCEN